MKTLHRVNNSCLVTRNIDRVPRQCYMLRLHGTQVLDKSVMFLVRRRISRILMRLGTWKDKSEYFQRPRKRLTRMPSHPIMTINSFPSSDRMFDWNQWSLYPGHLRTLLDHEAVLSMSLLDSPLLCLTTEKETAGADRTPQRYVSASIQYSFLTVLRLTAILRTLL